MALTKSGFKDQNWSHLGEGTNPEERRREEEEEEEEKPRSSQQGTRATSTSRHESDVHEPRRDA